MKTRSKPWLSAFLGCGVFLSLLSAAVANPSKHTANYVKGHGEFLEGEEVGVDIAWVQPLRWADSDYTAYFVAHTWDEREKVAGGAIFVAIAKHRLEKFLGKYHTSPDVEGRGYYSFDLDSRRLTSVLRKGSDGSLFLDLSDGGVDSPGAIFRGKVGDLLDRLRSQ